MNLTKTATVLAALVLAGCASINPVAYNAQPERIRDPQKEIVSLLLANTVQGCVTEPQIDEKMLVVKYVCNTFIGNVVARFDKVDKIYLEQSGEWFRVTAHHSSGIADFQWTSKSLDDMQRLADALTAMTPGQGGGLGIKGKKANPV